MFVTVRTNIMEAEWAAGEENYGGRRKLKKKKKIRRKKPRLKRTGCLKTVWRYGGERATQKNLAWINASRNSSYGRMTDGRLHHDSSADNVKQS